MWIKRCLRRAKPATAFLIGKEAGFRYVDISPSVNTCRLGSKDSRTLRRLTVLPWRLERFKYIFCVFSPEIITQNRAVPRYSTDTKSTLYNCAFKKIFSIIENMFVYLFPVKNTA